MFIKCRTITERFVAVVAVWESGNDGDALFVNENWQQGELGRNSEISPTNECLYKSYMTNSNHSCPHRNIEAYQKKTSAVCQSVREIFEIVSMGHFRALSPHGRNRLQHWYELKNIFFVEDQAPFTKLCTSSITRCMADILLLHELHFTTAVAWEES